MNDLSGKVVLITGSGRGIGRSIALEFAARGAKVVINYAHSETEARKLHEQIGAQSILLQADLNKMADIERLVAQTVKQLGGLDILVNNAGVEKKAPFWEVTEADFDQVMQVDLKAVFFTTQKAVQYWMQEKKPGAVINVSSVHEELPFPGYASYCAAKGGIGMLTKTLAVELGPLGIRVNGIAPGAIATEINKDLLADKERLQKLTAQIPSRRLGKPEEVAKIATFLASEDAAYVNGSTYFVDGGLSINYLE